MVFLRIEQKILFMNFPFEIRNAFHGNISSANKKRLQAHEYLTKIKGNVCEKIYTVKYIKGASKKSYTLIKSSGH